MKKRIARNVLLAAAFLCVASVIWVANLNYGGFCLDTASYPSDAQRVEVAVKKILDKYPPAVIPYVLTQENGELKRRKLNDTSRYTTYSLTPPTDPIPYKSVQEFFLLNPQCCELVSRPNDDSPEPTLFERLSGGIYGFVKISYVVRFRDEEGAEKFASHKITSSVNNCGVPKKIN